MLNQGSRESKPRWGSEGREQKATAILSSLLAYSDEKILNGLWVDVGCGSGGMVSALAPYVRRVVGVDPEPWPQWSECSSSRLNASFVIAYCDRDEFPLLPDSADIIICNQVYEHVRDPQKLLFNIYTLLKPGGVCYFAGPNLLWPIEPHLFWPFVHWFPRSFSQELMALLGSKQFHLLDANSTHYWKLVGWMKGQGFEVFDGIKTRLFHSLVNASMLNSAKFVSKIPLRFFRAAHPLSPGFVFILSKR